MKIPAAKFDSDFPISPADLGFPAHMTAWQDAQGRFLNFANEYELHKGIKVLAVNMPTGSGKSGAGVGFGKSTGLRCGVLTHTKSLQDQYMRDFEPCGMVKVQGRSNYDCPHTGTNCEEGSIAKCPHVRGSKCPYRDALDKGNKSDIFNANYAVWLATARHAEPIHPVSCLVMDEAHDAGEYLCDAMAFEFSEHDIGRKLNVRPPAILHRMDKWKEWATTNIQTAKLLMADAKDRIQVNPSSATIKEYTRMRRLVNDLEFLGALNIREWVVDQARVRDMGVGSVQTYWKFSLIHPRGHRDLLTQGADTTIMLSGTLTPYAVERLGYAPNEYAYMELDSPFDYWRCPVYALSRAPRITHKSTPAERLRWVETMDRIMDGRTDRNGLIHVSSYDQADFIRANSRHKSRMIGHDPGSQRAARAVRELAESNSPRVLVSPAIHTGYDFKYRLAEFQIIGKMPFPDTRSRVMMARCGVNGEERTREQQDYADNLVVSTVTQQAGRVMRAEDDRGETFICDSNFTWFFRQTEHKWPGYFRRAVRFVDKIVAAPYTLTEEWEAREKGIVLPPRQGKSVDVPMGASAKPSPAPRASPARPISRPSAAPVTDGDYFDDVPF